MRLRRFALGLLVMAAAVVPLKSQTTMSVVTSGSTTPPTAFTAAEVRAQGGEGECRWQAGPYGECSESCEGTQTRQVSCQCTLASTEQVRATDDNCDRDDPRIAPLTSRSCGIECPPPDPTTQTPTNITESPQPVNVTDSPQPATKSDDASNTEDKPTPRSSPRIPEAACTATRECNLTECRNQSDCCSDECCLQVRVSGPEATGNFFCFPLLQLNDFCDPEANWTCPCGVGLTCTATCVPQPSKHMHKPKKPRSEDPYEDYRPEVRVTGGDCCPALYNKGKKPRDHRAVCVSASDPPKPKPYCCDTVECDDQRDCDEDECCLEVDLELRKNTTTASYCVPFVGEKQPCDPNGSWSCPCREGLDCTLPTPKPKPPKPKPKPKLREMNPSMYYRPRVVSEEHEVCPKLLMKVREPERSTPTCKQLTSSHVRDHNQERPERHSSERHNSKGQCPGGRKSGLRYGPTAQKHSPEKPRPTKPGPQKPRPKNHGPEKPTPAKPGPVKPRPEKHGPAKTGHGPNEHE